MYNDPCMIHVIKVNKHLDVVDRIGQSGSLNLEQWMKVGHFKFRGAKWGLTEVSRSIDVVKHFKYQ